jgi:hypothetical protein
LLNHQSAPWRSKAISIAGDEMSASSNPSEAPNVQATAPTGYLVSIVPGAIEVSARLATADELRGLVQALTVSMAILPGPPQADIESLSKRLTKANAA